MAAITDDELISRIATYADDLYEGADDSEFFHSIAESCQSNVFATVDVPFQIRPMETKERQGTQVGDPVSEGQLKQIATVVQLDEQTPKRGMRSFVAAIAATVVLLGGLTIGVFMNGFGSSGQKPMLIAGWVPKNYLRGSIPKLQGHPPALVPGGRSTAFAWQYLSLIRERDLSFVSIFVNSKDESASTSLSEDGPAFPDSIDPSVSTPVKTSTVSRSIQVGVAKTNVAFVGTTYMVKESGETFQNWAGEFSIDQYPVHILSVAEPSVLESVLASLKISGPHPITNSLPDGWSVDPPEDGLDGNTAQHPLVLYQSKLDKRDELAVFTVGKRTPMRSPTQTTNGRRIWVQTPKGQASDNYVFATVEYQGVIGQISGRISSDELLQVGANLRVVSNVYDAKEVDISPVYAVGSQTVEGTIKESGQLSDGTLWRLVEPRYPDRSTLVGLIGVPEADVDTRFPGTLTAEWAGPRETITIFALPVSVDPKEVMVRANGKTLRVPFLSAKTLSYRYAFVPMKLNKTSDVSIDVIDHGVAVTRHGADLIWDKKGLTR